MSKSVFGKSKDGGSFVKKNYWKLRDGVQVYRILPAVGELAEDGIWSQYYSVHFGYKNSQGKLRPFHSPEVKNQKGMIEVPDAAKQRIETLRSQREKAKEAGDEAKVKRIDQALQVFNLDNKHYVNAMDEQGNIGLLKLGSNAKKALNTLIKSLEKEGVDPRDPSNGRFIVFTRSGMGRDTQVAVSVKQEELDIPNVGKVKRDVVSSLTEEMAARIGSWGADGKFKYKEASNLLTLFKKPSSAEVERIVREGASAVDEILDTKKTEATASTSESDEYDDEYGLDSLAEESASPAPVEVKQVSTPSVFGARKEVAVEQKPSVQKAAPAPSTPTASPKSTAEILATQSDEDFFKSLGVEL